MARRPSFDEPMSRLAAWSGRLALFALAVAVLSILILRANVLEIEPALATFGAALALAGLAVLLALLSFVSIWRHGRPGLGRATVGLLLGLALLAYPAYLGYRASKLPALTDISTDTENPPRFIALAKQRPPGRIDYPGGKAADQQDEAYPDLAALQLDIAPQEAYRAALGVALKRKWQLIDAHPPGGVRREGVIELVARTPIMGFRDDVVIRVAPSEDGARIDVRSASRYGTHDFGANAARIRSLLEDIDDAAGEISPEPQPAAAPEKEKKPSKRPPRRGTRR
jgi:uncharacterized protein (DUF1499 family)